MTVTGNGWTSTAELDALIPAFVDALAELDDVTRDRVADTGSYSYRYAELAAVTGHARAILKTHDLAVTQIPLVDGDVEVITIVWHRSGQRLVFPPLRLPVAGGSVQQIGSAITYARRYALMAILGLAPEDDDGAAVERTLPGRTPPVELNRSGARPDALTATQRRKMNAAFDAIGIVGRSDKIAFAAGIIDRAVASAVELTVDEATRVIDALEAVNAGTAELVLDDNGVPVGSRPGEQP